MDAWLSEYPFYQPMPPLLECECVSKCVRCLVGGRAWWPIGCWRGWMDECEHLFHTPFTATGLTHLSEMPLSFCLSDVHFYGFHWWIVTSPSSPPLHPSVWRGHILKCFSCGVRGHIRASAANKCASVNMSGRPAFSAFVLYIVENGDLKKQVQKSKCRDMVSCSSCLNKWFISTGGYLQAPVTYCFLP